MTAETRSYASFLRLGIVFGVLAVALELFAMFALSTAPPSNSHLWFPLNTGYFGGIVLGMLAAGLGLAGLASPARTIAIAVPLMLAGAAFVVVVRLWPPS